MDADSTTVENTATGHDQETMNAMVQTGYGSPAAVLAPRQMPIPVPGAEEVLVRVRATSVNTPDWITVTGVPYAIRLQNGLRSPKTPIRGTDFAGVVEGVGEDVVDFEPGDEVFGSSWADTLKTVGTFAEYTVAQASQMIKKPESVSFEEAAASVMSGLTALVGIRDTAEVGESTRVLVNGASGGVGVLAVQIAKHLGAEVTGVCSTRNVELVMSLGADRVVDYTKEDFTELPERYDVILDNVINHKPTKVRRALAPGGVFMPNSVGNTGGLFAGLPRMARAMLMGMGSTDVRTINKWSPDHDNLGDLAALMESGDLRIIIEETYPLVAAGKAVDHMFSHRARGKIAISI